MPAKQAVRFASPESLAVEVELPNAGRVRGFGVRVGVTLIVGGGFHGKSTLLEALQAGVYNKARSLFWLSFWCGGRASAHSWWHFTWECAAERAGACLGSINPSWRSAHCALESVRANMRIEA